MEKRLTADMNVVANSNLEIQLLDGDLNVIQKLDDEPNDVGGLTSAELKAKFDESGNIIKKYINETLIPAVLADDATEESRKQAEAARVAAEQGRVTAEEGRVSAEAARAAAEQARSEAESSRVSAENARAQAETVRASAETTRVGNETARNQGETVRVAAENARANAEMNRNQAEQNRAHSETARDQAETARRNSENIRATSEVERAQAEQNRVSAENNRVSAEASRSQDEAARKSAESTRQTNETVRQNAESARQTAETNRAQAETARNVWEDYDSAKNYQPGNKVYWQGSSYVCLKPCSGISPENGTYWQLVVRSGFTSDSAFGFDVVNGRLLCYYSGDNPPPFRLGDDGHLYVDLDKTYDLGKVTGGSGSGGGVDIDLGITGAQVGQIAKIAAVDDTGKPTAWSPAGADGKSAYQYAVEGGYTGTEAEFAEKMAEEQLTGTTDELTPTQVYNAVSAGIPVKVQYTSSTYGLLSFMDFNVAESLNVIVSQTIAYYNGVYILVELLGNKSENTWGFMTTTLAQKTDIPTTLPNPKALTFTGAVTGIYDGSAPLSVNIPSAVTDDNATGVGGETWETINVITLSDAVNTVTINKDSGGNAIALKKVRILAEGSATHNQDLFLNNSRYIRAAVVGTAASVGALSAEPFCGKMYCFAVINNYANYAAINQLANIFSKEITITEIKLIVNNSGTFSAGTKFTIQGVRA